MWAKDFLSSQADLQMFLIKNELREYCSRELLLNIHLSVSFS